VEADLTSNKGKRGHPNFINFPVRDKGYLRSRETNRTTINMNTFCSSVISFSVTLDDGTIVPYIRRGLRQEQDQELKQWAEFCASVFADKNPPPPSTYFERHFTNDPLARLDWIRVVLYNDKIVSSCRIFHRDVSLGGGTYITAGGIGEVCTSKQHRHRGLSKLLLQDSLTIMKSHGFSLSFLHAAPEFFPVYERGGGYSSTISEWSVAKIDLDALENYQSSSDALSSSSIRLAEFPRDTLRLQDLHREYSEQTFIGCLHRSEDYWNQFISKELEGTLFVLENNDTVMSWMSLRRRGDCVQLREFGHDYELTLHERKIVMAKLLWHSLGKLQDLSLCNTTLGWKIPTFLLHAIGNSDCPYVQSSWEENDYGWMYVTLQHEAVDMVKLNQSQPHLIWPSDSF
jgi:hypothetical protein